MVTGASTADVAIILVDARKGVIEQTRRHSYIASILGILHVVVAVNKMDLADFSEERFREIEQELRETSERLGLRDVQVIPMSALRGTTSSSAARRCTLVRRAHAARLPRDGRDRRRPRPRPPPPRPVGDPPDRGRAPRLPRLRGPGRRRRLAGGRRRRRPRLGDGRRVAAVEPDRGVPGMSVTIRLADDLDVSRGDMLADPEQAPTVAGELEATVCWMAEKPSSRGRSSRSRHDAHGACDRRRTRRGRRHPRSRISRALSGSS